MEDQRWLLWGQDSTYVFPLGTWTWKTLFSFRVYVSRLSGHFLLADGVSRCGCFQIAVSTWRLPLSFCVIVSLCDKEGYLPAPFVALKYPLWNTRALPSVQLWPQLSYKGTLRGFYTSGASNKPSVVLIRSPIFSHFIRCNIYWLKKLQFWIFSVSLRRNYLEHLTFQCSLSFQIHLASDACDDRTLLISQSIHFRAVVT